MLATGGIVQKITAGLFAHHIVEKKMLIQVVSQIRERL